MVLLTRNDMEVVTFAQLVCTYPTPMLQGTSLPLVAYTEVSAVQGVKECYHMTVTLASP